MSLNGGIRSRIPVVKSSLDKTTVLELPAISKKERRPKEVKKVRRRWESDLHAARSPSWSERPAEVMGGCSQEWREEWSEDSQLDRLLQMAADLVEDIDSNQLCQDEKNYRREQALFWLIRAAQRGSQKALAEVAQMAVKGEGVTEKNWPDVMDCLNASNLQAKRMAQVTLQKLDSSTGRRCLSVSQMYRFGVRRSDADLLDADDVRTKLSGSFRDDVSLKELQRNAAQFLDGRKPDLTHQLASYAVLYHRKWFSLDALKLMLDKMYLMKLLSVAAIFVPVLHVLPMLIFWSTDSRQFEMWSSLWLSATQISRQDVYMIQMRRQRRQIVSASLWISFCWLFSPNMGIEMSLATLLCGLLIMFRCGPAIVMLVGPIISYILVGCGWLYHAPDLAQYLMPMAMSVLIAVTNRVDLLLLMACSSLTHLHPGSPDPLIKILWISLTISSVCFFCFRHKILRRRCLALLALGLTFVYLERIKDSSEAGKVSSPVALTWHRYSQLCSDDHLDFHSEMRCQLLIGLEVAWQGRLQQIEVISDKSHWLEPMLQEMNIPVPKTAAAHFPKLTSLRTEFCKMLQTELQLPECDFMLSQSRHYQCKLRLEMSSGSLFGGPTHSLFAEGPMSVCSSFRISEEVRVQGILTGPSTLKIKHIQKVLEK